MPRNMIVRKSVYLSEINIFSKSTLVSKVILNAVESFLLKKMIVRKSVYLSEINIFSKSTLVSKVFLNAIESFLPRK